MSWAIDVSKSQIKLSLQNNINIKFCITLNLKKNSISVVLKIIGI
jgi:hypothetical protein